MTTLVLVTGGTSMARYLLDQVTRLAKRGEPIAIVFSRCAECLIEPNDLNNLREAGVQLCVLAEGGNSTERGSERSNLLVEIGYEAFVRLVEKSDRTISCSY